MRMFPSPIAVADEAIKDKRDRDLGRGEVNRWTDLAAAAATSSPAYQLILITSDAVWPFHQQSLAKWTAFFRRDPRFGSIMVLVATGCQGLESLERRE